MTRDRKRVRWTDAQDRKLVEPVRKGDASGEIAAHVGARPAEIRKRCEELGSPGLGRSSARSGERDCGLEEERDISLEGGKAVTMAGPLVLAGRGF